MKPGIDYVGAAVFAMIFNDKNQVMLAYHKPTKKKNSDFANKWSMPGGAIEFGETSQEALQRELKEELNLSISDIQFINHTEYINDGRHWIALNFKVKTKSEPKILEPEKIAEIKFFDQNEIPDNISYDCQKCFQDLGILK